MKSGSGRGVPTGDMNNTGSKPRARSMRRTLRSGVVTRIGARAMKVQPINVPGGKVLPRTVRGAISRRSTTLHVTRTPPESH